MKAYLILIRFFHDKKRHGDIVSGMLRCLRLHICVIYSWFGLASGMLADEEKMEPIS
jgi:hypothetical protein